MCKAATAPLPAHHPLTAMNLILSQGQHPVSTGRQDLHITVSLGVATLDDMGLAGTAGEETDNDGDGQTECQGDCASLFKPAVLAVADGGSILATNHVPSVPLDSWIDGLKRTADKAGRSLKQIDVLEPEADFPSFDGQPPLKIAICSV